MVVRFILNFAEENAIILPGRIPGFKRDDVKALPSNLSKSAVWRVYKAAVKEGDRVVASSTFRKMWSQLLPYVVVCKPASDLCWVCQANNNLIVKQASPPHTQTHILNVRSCLSLLLHGKIYFTNLGSTHTHNSI